MTLNGKPTDPGQDSETRPRWFRESTNNYSQMAILSVKATAFKVLQKIWLLETEFTFRRKYAKTYYILHIYYNLTGSGYNIYKNNELLLS